MGCVLTIVGLVVFIMACYGFCTLLFYLGNPEGSQATSTGSQILLWLLG